MTTMDFEYAIKKDVRNNPIVREIDAAHAAGSCGARPLWGSFSW